MKRFPEKPQAAKAPWQAKDGLPPGVQPQGGQRRHHYLKPGELYVGEEQALVETVLGSCVAIAMYSPRHLVGALSHSMLPSGGDSIPLDEHCRGARFVDWAIQCMLDWFLNRGVLHKEIVVKLFGGSEMFVGDRAEAFKGVGRQNIERALQLIDQERLYLAAFDLGGSGGRKIFFKTDTGEVFLRRLRRAELL